MENINSKHMTMLRVQCLFADVLNALIGQFLSADYLSNVTRSKVCPLLRVKVLWEGFLFCNVKIKVTFSKNRVRYLYIYYIGPTLLNAVVEKIVKSSFMA
jgi:hypothetical protein